MKELSTEDQELFRNMFQKHSAVMLLVNPEIGSIVDANDSAVKFYGYEKEKICSMNINEINTLSKEEIAKRMADAGNRDKNLFEFPHKLSNGEIRIVEVYSSPVTHNGKTLLFSIIQDITDRKKNEESLKSKSALLESQINATIDAILIVDENHKRILTNKKIKEMFDVPDNIINNSDDILLLNHVMNLTVYPDKFIEKVNYLYSHDMETSRDEVEFKNGMILDRYSTPVLDDNEKNYGRIWIFRDITEKKINENNLKNYNNLLLGLTHATDCIISSKVLNKKNITDALKALGLATLVDRVYIFEHIPGAKGKRGYMSQKYEWSIKNIEPQIDNPKLQNIAWDDVAPRWYDAFISGGYISGDVVDFPDNERSILEPQSILSLLAIPIDADGKLWGFIGFDSCSKTRKWNLLEIGLLKSIANSFAVSIERMKAEKNTKDKMIEIQEMNEAMEGREFKIITLKREIDSLHDKISQLEREKNNRIGL